MADLNALIAQGAQFAAPVDPFAQYGKMQQLQQGETANQLNRMKMEEMQAANTERNALRQLDPTSPDYESQLFKVNPTMGIAYRKEAATAAAQQATQKAQQAEALKTNLANHRSFLVGVNDQPSYDAWRALTIKNIPDLASILPAQFSPETKDGLLKTADDMSKRLTAAPVATPLSKLITERNALLPGDPNRKLYDDAIQKESQFAPRAITNVNMPPNEKAYSTEIGQGAGKQDLAAINRSQIIPQDFAKIDETLGVLRNSDINTGIGAELFTVLDKARAQVAADKKAGTRSVNTEYLNSLLGSAVFPQIQALGIGARGMDTPAEREFLRSVMTGTIGLNKDTLIKMTELRRKGLESEANLFNKQVKEGVFSPYEEAARRKVSAIAIPETLQSGADRIPTEGSAPKPAAAIPQSAINALKAGKGTDAQFDEIFGVGAAKRAKGGK